MINELIIKKNFTLLGHEYKKEDHIVQSYTDEAIDIANDVNKSEDERYNMLLILREKDRLYCKETLTYHRKPFTKMPLFAKESYNLSAQELMKILHLINTSKLEPKDVEINYCTKSETIVDYNFIPLLGDERDKLILSLLKNSEENQKSHNEILEDAHKYGVHEESKILSNDEMSNERIDEYIDYKNHQFFISRQENGDVFIMQVQTVITTLNNGFSGVDFVTTFFKTNKDYSQFFYHMGFTESNKYIGEINLNHKQQ